MIFCVTSLSSKAGLFWNSQVWVLSAVVELRECRRYSSLLRADRPSASQTHLVPPAFRSLVLFLLLLFLFFFFKPLLLIALGHPAVTLFIWFVAVPGISRARPVKAEPLPDALLLSL